MREKRRKEINHNSYKLGYSRQKEQVELINKMGNGTEKIME